MPAARAYMLSLLVVRRLSHRDDFLQKFPHCWLLWEPGQWQPSTGSTPTRVASAEASPGRPPGGDALCYELATERVMRVGRLPECELQINDATVSREHLQLEPVASGRWSIRAISASSPTSVDDRPLGLQELRELTPRAAVKIGDVTVTFHTPATFVARLDQMIARAQHP